MKGKQIAILTVVIFLLGALSGGLVQHAWFRHGIEQRTDTATVWMPATLDTASMVVTTAPAPPSVPPVIVPAENVTPAADSAAVQIRPELVTVTGTLSGGLTYQAQLLGVQPSLQSLQVNYPKTTITTSTTIREPYKGWLLSATSSISAYTAPQIQTFWTVALETSYNVGRLHIGLQGGVADTWSSAAGHQISPYIGGRVTFDIFRMK